MENNKINDAVTNAARKLHLLVMTSGFEKDDIVYIDAQDVVDIFCDLRKEIEEC